MNTPVAFRRCQICETPALCDRERRCQESVALLRQNERMIAVQAKADIPELREHRRIKADFSGYLMVGGPHDGDFVRFTDRGVMSLDRVPRPGAPPRSSQGRIAVEEYQAEFVVGGKRFYRHRSLSLPQAVNRLLLWYLPPEALDEIFNNAAQAAEQLVAPGIAIEHLKESDDES